MPYKAIAYPLLVAAVAGIAWGFGSEALAAQLFAVASVLLVTLLLFTTGRRRNVALKPFSYGDDGKRVDSHGVEVPDEALADTERVRVGQEYEVQRGLYFRGLYVGKDGRWSTSKLQVLLWTYAVVYALASIFFAKAIGIDGGLTKLLAMDQAAWATYLILLGGPFAAFVLAQGITSAKVDGETVAKTEVEPTTNAGDGLSQVISNDAGETDIVDLQYFLFNLLALGYFLLSFVPDPASGLPELPEILVALTGASAATYVAKKATERAQPTITTMLPAKARTGGTLDVWGRWLVLGEPTRADRKPRVSIGTEEVTDGDVKIITDTSAGADHLQLTVPTTVEPGATVVRIVTLAGVSAESPIEIESGVVIRTVSTAKVQLGAPEEIAIAGEGFGTKAPGAAVLLDGVALDTADWGKTSITASLRPQATYNANQQAALVVQNADGRRSKDWTLAVE